MLVFGTNQPILYEINSSYDRCRCQIFYKIFWQLKYPLIFGIPLKLLWTMSPLAHCNSIQGLHETVAVLPLAAVKSILTWNALFSAPLAENKGISWMQTLWNIICYTSILFILFSITVAPFLLLRFPFELYMSYSGMDSLFSLFSSCQLPWMRSVDIAKDTEYVLSDFYNIPYIKDGCMPVYVNIFHPATQQTESNWWIVGRLT